MIEEELKYKVEIHAGQSNFGEYYEEMKIFYNDHLIRTERDKMEPEDAIFCRDLKWIKKNLKI